MTLYIAQKERRQLAEAGRYTAWGVAAVRRGKVCAAVGDIYLSGWDAWRLALRCTLARLDPAQLPDVAEDALA